MGKASSSKKVSRAAKAGGKTKVRGQQGLVFPIALGLVVVLGITLIAYARQSSPSTTADPPTTDDRWHNAYGVYGCDTWLDPIQSQNDQIDGTPIGIFTLGDGVIHIHPASSVATGGNAQLGLFFQTSGIKMSNTKLEMPEGLGTFTNGDACGGKDGLLKVLVWDDAFGTSAPKIYVTDFGSIPFANDRAAITIAFVNNDTDLSTLRPLSIPTLDSPGLDPPEGTTPQPTTPSTGSTGAGTTAPGTTAPGTTVAGTSTTLG